jgi:hypothetical protein
MEKQMKNTTTNGESKEQAEFLSFFEAVFRYLPAPDRDALIETASFWVSEHLAAGVSR